MIEIEEIGLCLVWRVALCNYNICKQFGFMSDCFLGELGKNHVADCNLHLRRHPFHLDFHLKILVPRILYFLACPLLSTGVKLDDECI